MTVASPRHRELGLTDREYELIVEHMEREPERGRARGLLADVVRALRLQALQAAAALAADRGRARGHGPGRERRRGSLGGGLACAFKVESHNHPSAVEPFQGAATGVGGILRDVFAVGARPIAILDSLRFGEVARSPRSRYLLEQAVAGIGHYGNSIGVATVGGEIYFEDAYEQNCLVNAMCLGLIQEDDLIRSAAAGVGNVVLLFGARTGRDGIGGASVLASRRARRARRREAPDGPDRRPVRGEEAARVLAGAARARAARRAAGPRRGRASRRRRAEMASKGEVGIDIDVRKVPLREADMEAFEIMISESQERMLCVVEPDRVDEVVAVCEKWLVNATAIGEVTDTRRLRVFDGGALVGDMPVTALVDECPVYDLAPVAPSVSMYPAPAPVPDLPADPGGILLALLGSANLASRRWAFEQYDCLVGSRTVRRPEQADAAVLQLPGGSAIAVSIDGNGRRVACDPYRGAVEAVLECSANLACVGAEPLGLTNCLNFGNPEKPHVAWQLSRAVAGLADACRALGIPVVGGNVSLYNEAGAGPIFPTPVVGLVGELPKAARSGRLGFAQDGDVVAVISAGSWAPAATGSELAKLRGEAPLGELPHADLGELRALHAAVRQAVRAGALRSAHDVAEGGLAAALAEACLAGGLGATVDLSRCAPPARRSCSARARARSSSPARSSRCARSAARRCGSGRSAAPTSSSTAL